MVPRRAFDLERLAFAAWPAERVEHVCGWRVRFHHGVTNRANSVWPVEFADGASLDDAITRVEAFYAARGLPARFQVSPQSEPSGLDAALAERGYRLHLRTTLRTAEVDRVLTDSPGEELSVETSPQLDEAWFEISGRRGRYQGAAAAHYRAILLAARERRHFVRAHRRGQTVGVGLGVSDGSWLGIFSMLTLPEARRSGVGRAVLGGLARAAGQAGCERLYLQVEDDNAPALALYAGFGFEPAFSYHYRLRELG